MPAIYNQDLDLGLGSVTVNNNTLYIVRGSYTNRDDGNSRATNVLTISGSTGARLAIEDHVSLYRRISS